MNVPDIMRRSYATIKPDAPLLDAAHLLTETNQRGLPVIDHDGALVGVISEGDFLHRTELDISPPPGNWLEELLGIEEDTPARRRMRARLVREVMTRDPICVDDEATLDESLDRHMAVLQDTDDAVGLRLARQIEIRMHRGHHDVQLRKA